MKCAAARRSQAKQDLIPSNSVLKIALPPVTRLGAAVHHFCSDDSMLEHLGLLQGASSANHAFSVAGRTMTQCGHTLLAAMTTITVRQIACVHHHCGPGMCPDPGQGQSTFDWSKAPHAHPYAALKAAAMLELAASRSERRLAPG